MKKLLGIGLLLVTSMVIFAGWDSIHITFPTKQVPTEESSDENKSATNRKENTEHPVKVDREGNLVLVNKQHALSEEVNPNNLVYPEVPFTFSEKIDKRKLQKEAAEALEELFLGASSDGISLLGVSAYRSHESQKNVFDHYVHQDGEEMAMTYSAVPGHSEHETGLAIDVTGENGQCQAEECFADTEEAKWLADHAAEYGFIIRYPKGKESITGYKYEPWHLRYVGKDVALEISSKGITLEEYLGAV